VFVYSLEARAVTQLTDGLGDARTPAWDRGGEYLYFAASTDLGPLASPGSMAGMNRPSSRAVYAVVLRKDLPSPLAPESDEEKPEEKKEKTSVRRRRPRGCGEGKDGRQGEGEEGRGRRERRRREEGREAGRGEDRPRPRRPAHARAADPRRQLRRPHGRQGRAGLPDQGPARLSARWPAATYELVKFDLEKRKTETLVSGATETSLAAAGEKYLYKKDDAWFIAATDAPAKPGEGAVKVAEAQVWVDPRSEWRQMYHETWRIQRDFLYDPGYHGLDLAAAEAKYAPWVDGLASRADLNALFEEMLGESRWATCSWRRRRPEPPMKGGLRCRPAVENGRYRFARCWTASWNPDLRALTQPGVFIAAGEYLIAVNGESHAPAPLPAARGDGGQIRRAA
jgi:tricorn protease